jgi:hypothetical protein
MSFTLKPRAASPMAAAAALSLLRMLVDEICDNRPDLGMYVLTEKLLFDPGCDLMRDTMDAHAWTGHRNG